MGPVYGLSHSFSIGNSAEPAVLLIGNFTPSNKISCWLPDYIWISYKYSKNPQTKKQGFSSVIHEKYLSKNSRKDSSSNFSWILIEFFYEDPVHILTTIPPDTFQSIVSNHNYTLMNCFGKSCKQIFVNQSKVSSRAI